MAKRILIVVVVAVAVLATGIVADTAYGGNIPINWRVSGTIVFVQFAIPTATGIDNTPGLMIDAFLKGEPSRAQFRVLAAATRPPEPIPECFGDGQYFDFDDMVTTFEDLSMLFAKMDPDLRGWTCFTGEPAVANMVITGGTGRYKDAQGQYQGIFEGTTIGDSGALIAETGTIKGWIER